MENAFVIWAMTRPSPTTGIVGRVSFPEGPTQSYPFIDGGNVRNGGVSMKNGCFSLIKHAATNFGIYAPGHKTFSEPVGSGYFYARVNFGPAGSASSTTVDVEPISLIRYAIETITCNRGDALNSIEVFLWEQIQAGKPFVDLATIGPERWERFCVIGPYSSSETAGKVIGFPWDVEKQYPDIPANEGAQVLVFVRGQRVIASSEHYRGRGDFVSLEGQCLSRAQSKLVMKKDTQERTLLVRPDSE
jgi:hypothetical protein